MDRIAVPQMLKMLLLWLKESLVVWFAAYVSLSKILNPSFLASCSFETFYSLRTGFFLRCDPLSHSDCFQSKPVHQQKHQKWTCGHRISIKEQWEKVARPEESHYIMWIAIRCLPGDALREEGEPVEASWCFGHCSAGKPWFLPCMLF